MAVTTLATLTLLTLWLLLRVIRRWQNFEFFQARGIPGPRPSFWFGNLAELRGSPRSPLQVYREWEGKYGRTYGYFAGVRPTLVIRDLDMVNEVLVRRSLNLSAVRLTPAIQTKPLMDTIVGLRGQRWKELRRVLATTFTAESMRKWSELMNGSLNTTLEILEASGGGDVDILSLYQGLSCEVISAGVLSMEVDCQRDPTEGFLVAVREFLQHALHPFVFLAQCFPCFARVAQFIIDRTALSTRMTRIVCSSVRRGIQSRREGVDCGSPHGGTGGMDVLQKLLDAAEQSSHRRMRRITDDEIVANSWVFLLGGFETTSAALTFASYLLAIHPQVQQTLFEELQGSFGNGEDGINYNSVNELRYLDQVVCEALRLYPPVVTFMVRETDTELNLGPHSLPKGVSIFIPIWQIQHDPDLWPDPERFDPSRFSPDRRKKYHPMAWIPFGAGPRKCIGMRFAMLEMKLALARIIRSFRLVPSARTSQPPKLTVPTVTIVPEDKIFVKFERR